MAKNSRKRAKARREAAQKKYERMAAAMEPGYVPEKDPLQTDPDFRARIRQGGGIIEKKGEKFVLVSPPKAT